MLEDIEPCQHIKLVLNSKAKESVLVTYKQALKISLLISDKNSYKLVKDNSQFPVQKLQDLKLKALECSTCHINNFNQSFICLQCPNVSCINHGSNHFKLNQHMFSLDSTNGLLYCFKCNNYINHPYLNEIRNESLSYNPNKSTEEDLNEFYNDPSPQSVKGLKGFINFGSTCFISSVLQTFIHNPKLKQHFFNSDEHYFNCELNQCITCSVNKIFTEFFTSENTDSFGMTNLLINSWYKNKSLTGYQEQDAHEFWQYMLNEFHKDYQRVEGIGESNGEDYHGKDCKCLTHKYFSGELESTIKCPGCNKMTKTIDPTMDLSLELTNLKPNSTIYDCLDLFTKSEVLEHYNCQFCNKKNTKAVKSLKINKISTVLSIQLKRFKHSGSNFIKNDLQIKNPLYLDLRNYTTTSTNHQNYLYELFALIIHSGSVNTGHYIVIVKNQFNQWFKFDDSIITLVDETEIETTNAYLLFYISHQI